MSLNAAPPVPFPVVSTEFVHEALYYADDDAFAAAVTSFLREGLRLGHAAVAAVTRHNLGLLRQSLGPDAARVTLLDRDEWYRRPAATVAGWAGLLAEAQARGQGYMRIVGEVAFGDRQPRHATWTRYEAALNSVFAGTPAWIVCPYDTRALPDAVLADACRTHPAVSGSGRATAGGYRRPEELLREIDEPMPEVDGPPTGTLTLRDVDSVGVARHLVHDALTAGAWSLQRVQDAVLVVSEVAGNSLRHGSGHRELRLWLTARSVVCEVSDEGVGIGDPMLCYRPPAQTPEAGRGLWIANQLCDHFAVAHHEGRTRVRFRLDR